MSTAPCCARRRCPSSGRVSFLLVLRPKEQSGTRWAAPSKVAPHEAARLTRTTAPRDRLSSARHREVFHSHGSIAGGVRSVVFDNASGALPSLSTGFNAPWVYGPLAGAALLRSEPLSVTPAAVVCNGDMCISRSITTLAHRFEQRPTALQRSDACIIRLV
jgi:hypothetical protein